MPDKTKVQQSLKPRADEKETCNSNIEHLRVRRLTREGEALNVFMLDYGISISLVTD